MDQDHPHPPLGAHTCCPPDPKSTGVLKYVYGDRVAEESSQLSEMFREAEPEIVERLNELIDAMGAAGFKPSSSAVLALFTMALALLLNQGYQHRQALLVVESLLPFADQLKDQLLSPLEQPGAGD